VFCRTPSVQPESKGFENPFQNQPNHLQSIKIQHRIQGAQFVSGFVPLNEQIKEKKSVFWGDMDYGERERNGGKEREMDGRQWCGGAEVPRW
jgi:hypothetical protein